MALSAAQLTRLARMGGEAHKAVGDRMVSDATIQLIADDSGLIVDSAGLAPNHADYVVTYDLFRIAAEIWRDKAGQVADSFDFIADGGEFKRSQTYAAYMQQAARYAGMSANLSVETGA